MRNVILERIADTLNYMALIDLFPRELPPGLSPVQARYDADVQLRDLRNQLGAVS